jgi:hypothetical protein
MAKNKGNEQAMDQSPEQDHFTCLSCQTQYDVPVLSAVKRGAFGRKKKKCMNGEINIEQTSYEMYTQHNNSIRYYFLRK